MTILTPQDAQKIDIDPGTELQTILLENSYVVMELYSKRQKISTSLDEKDTVYIAEQKFNVVGVSTVKINNQYRQQLHGMLPETMKAIIGKYEMMKQSHNTKPLF